MKYIKQHINWFLLAILVVLILVLIGRGGENEGRMNDKVQPAEEVRIVKPAGLSDSLDISEIGNDLGIDVDLRPEDFDL